MRTPLVSMLPQLKESAGTIVPLHSQVHEIHPSHAFLDVVDRRPSGSRTNSDPDPAACYSRSSENLAPQCEPSVQTNRFYTVADCVSSIDNADVSAALLHQGVKCAQYVSGGCNWVIPQHVRFFLLTFVSAVACKTSWAPGSIVLFVTRWTYVRIANPLDCLVT